MRTHIVACAHIYIGVTGLLYYSSMRTHIQYEDTTYSSMRTHIYRSNRTRGLVYYSSMRTQIYSMRTQHIGVWGHTYIGVTGLVYFERPHTPIYAAVCVLILLYMRPDAAVCVLILLHMRPDATVCVLRYTYTQKMSRLRSSSASAASQLPPALLSVLLFLLRLS